MIDHTNYEIRNKGLHLVKADRENFWDMMKLRPPGENSFFIQDAGSSAWRTAA